MPGKSIPRDRKKKRRKVEKSVSVGPKPERHPLFGNVPFVQRQVTGEDGKVYTWWQHDPDYEPTLPRGAVRGNVRNQSYCAGHHVPKYFYVDEEHSCIQCGKDFVFTATEQRYWYETLRFNFSSIPVRCLACRRARRSEHALGEQIARARADVGKNNPAGNIALARAIVEYHERTQHGNLNEAIAAARKAKDLWPDSVEPGLWEGVAQALAGRKEKARTALQSFLAQPGKSPAALKTKAEKYLQQL